MKKTLNVGGIVNELSGQSAFFKGAMPQSDFETSQKPNTVRTYGRDERTDERASVDSSRRTKRHPFEIYADQLARLQKLKAKALLEGENLSMSVMVREAIDQYLAQKE